LPVLLAPLAWSHARRLRESKSPSELIALLGDTGKLLAGFAVLFGVGLAL
jgi:1,4-dihydroxy-2-naphthoate octaprenyltransferase